MSRSDTPVSDDSAAKETIPFPNRPRAKHAPTSAEESSADEALDAIREATNAMHDVSRRIEDLARQFNCLGYFDEDDGPRAA